MIDADLKLAIAKLPVLVALVVETDVDVSSTPPDPPMSPHSSVYPSNLPVVVLYLKSPAAGEEFLSPVVPLGTLIEPVPPKSVPSVVVVTLILSLKYNRTAAPDVASICVSVFAAFRTLKSAESTRNAPVSL